MGERCYSRTFLYLIIGTVESSLSEKKFILFHILLFSWLLCLDYKDSISLSQEMFPHHKQQKKKSATYHLKQAPTCVCNTESPEKYLYFLILKAALNKSFWNRLMFLMQELVWKKMGLIILTEWRQYCKNITFFCALEWML